MDGLRQLLRAIADDDDAPDVEAQADELGGEERAVLVPAFAAHELRARHDDDGPWRADAVTRIETLRARLQR